MLNAKLRTIRWYSQLPVEQWRPRRRQRRRWHWQGQLFGWKDPPKNKGSFSHKSCRLRFACNEWQHSMVGFLSLLYAETTCNRMLRQNRDCNKYRDKNKTDNYHTNKLCHIYVNNNSNNINIRLPKVDKKNLKKNKNKIFNHVFTMCEYK